MKDTVETTEATDETASAEETPASAPAPIASAPVPVLVPDAAPIVPLLPTPPVALVVDPNAALTPGAALAATPTTGAAPVTALPTVVLNDPNAATALPVDPNAPIVAPNAAAATDAPAATALPSTAAFSEALAATVTEQVKTEVAKVAIEVLKPTPTISADVAAAATKAAADFASSLQTNNASTNNVAVSAMKDVQAPAPASPYTQVMQIVAPLKQHSDGNYTMTLHLKPEALGKVEVAITLQNGQISMQLNADNPDARQLLRDSMNDLRSELQSSGLSAGSLDVGTGDSQGQLQENRTNSSSSINATDGDEMGDAEFFARLANALPTTPSDGSLDVRV